MDIFKEPMTFHSKATPGFILTCLLLMGFDLTAEEPPRSSLTLSIQGKFLTATVKNALLSDVLKALNRQKPQSILITGVVLNTEESPMISTEMKFVPLLQGIQRLLIDQDYVLVQNEVDRADEKIGIFLEMRGQSQETAISVDSAIHSPIPALEDSDARSLLLEQLADLSDLDQLKSVLPAATLDPDRIVREHALKSLTLMFEDAPKHLLADMALSDPLPELRTEALNVLSDRREEWAVDILQEATEDADPAVSEHAATLLNRISLSSEE